MNLFIPLSIAAIVLIISVARAVYTGEIWGASYIALVAIALALILGGAKL